MSPYLKALLKLLDSKTWVGEGAWSKIIAIADAQTLRHLKSELLWESKYFTREDWLGSEVRDRLLKQINNRLNGDYVMEQYYNYLREFVEGMLQ